MTSTEAKEILHYATLLYPTFKRTPEQMDELAVVWAREFGNSTKAQVFDGFRNACKRSLDWMPSVPLIQNEVEAIAMLPRYKDPEEAFKEDHNGMTREEYRKQQEWFESEEGKKVMEQRRQQVRDLFKRIK